MRPYTPYDETELLALLRAGRHTNPLDAYWHIGDWVWQRVYHLRDYALSDTIWVWPDVGFACFTPRYHSLDWFIWPHQRGGETEIAFTDALLSRVTGEAWLQTATLSEHDAFRIGLLRERGFQPTDNIGLLMRCALSEPVSIPPLSAGYKLRAAAPEDAEAWADCVIEAFASDSMTTQNNLNLIAAPEYDPRFDSVVMAEDGTIAALARGWFDPQTLTGQLEPVGTHPDYRRLGLGYAAVMGALHALQNAGCTEVILHTRQKNPSAISLYEKAGFRPLHRLLAFERRRAATS